MSASESDEFEKVFADKSGWPGSNSLDRIARYFWQARQPEIDALNDEVELISIARKSQNAAYEKKIDALKAEVEILRKPEVEPIGYVNPRIISILDRRGSTDATIGAIKTTIYSEPLFTSPPSPKADEHAELGRFDSGLLPDWEGGSVDWWQDSIRNLLESAHDHYQEQHEEHCAFSKKMTAQLLINWGEALNEAKNPKAEWDAEGNPLNLEAAAMDLVDEEDRIKNHSYHGRVIRKFLKDQSCF